MEIDAGWAILTPTMIRIRFRHEDTLYTLRARLDHTPHAPLALRKVEVLEWTIEPPEPNSSSPSPNGSSGPLEPKTTG